MQLHYIIIHDYKALKDVGVNISSKYIFDFEKVNENEYTIEVKDNEDYIEDFFEDDPQGNKKRGRIIDVTAIVGKNGAGKSSILEYIKKDFPKENHPENTKNGTWIFGSEGSFLIYSKRIIEIHGKPVKNKKHLKIEEETFEFGPHYRMTNYLYYRSDFHHDPRHFGNGEGLYDISSRGYIESDSRQKRVEAGQITRTNGSSDLDFYYFGEIYRALNFLKENKLKEETIGFKLPKKIDIYTDYHMRVQGPIKRILPLEIEISKEHEKWSFENIKINFYENLLLNIFFKAINIYSRVNTIIKYNEYIEKLISKITEENKIIEEVTLEILADLIKEADPTRETEGTIKELIGNMRNLIEERIITIGKNISRASLDISIAQEKLIEIISSSNILKSTINFSWPGLSTGEQAYLSFMSRFFDAKKKMEETSRNYATNLIILIDEGDLGYHPEWQRKYFKTTIDFLRRTFEDKNIQLIFTSNTPYIISDLTKSHILFISPPKEENGSIKIEKKENNKAETFGANIHTLLSDSFFMEHGQIGEFAKQKINLIIEKLRDEKKFKEITQEEKNLILKAIKQIGEPLIRKKLEQMYDENLEEQGEKERLKRQIEELERRIKKIEESEGRDSKGQ